MIAEVTATVDSGVPHSDGFALLCFSLDCGAALTCQTPMSVAATKCGYSKC